MKHDKKHNGWGWMNWVMVIAWACVFTLGARVTYNIIASGATKPDGALFDGLLWLWVLMGVLLAKEGPFVNNKDRKGGNEKTGR